MTGTRRVALGACALLVSSWLVAAVALASPVRGGLEPGDTLAPTTDTVVQTTTSPAIVFAIGAIVGVVIGGGAAVGYHVRRARRRDDARGAVAPGPDRPSPTGPSSHADDAVELGRLVNDVIAVRDLVEPSSVLSQRLRAALEHAGVNEYAPVGERFDPAVHEAVETVATTETGQADLVASVQRVGYADHAQVIRVPHVVVYQLEPTR